MKVYESGDKFVLAVKGGQFREFESTPKAIILNNRPIPTRRWTTPPEVDDDLFKGHTWEYNYEFRELLCDDKHAYVLFVEYIQEKPSYMRGGAVFFVDEAYAKEKIEELRAKGNLAEFNWDASVPTWIEIERGFRYEDEDDEEEEES
ncbi:hypothetical protein [Sporosarcina sp. FA9]|uniref:hypothetical protein n=1 Tax=Sporosarcina sp. FA9 TaxID=3413030 RepID=UPI003F658DDF